MSSHFLFAEVVYWYPSEAGNCLFFFHELRVLRNTCKTSFALDCAGLHSLAGTYVGV